MRARPLLVGVAAGVVVGLLVGGVGGRLLMLALRLTTPGVDGVTTDDGFTIGRLSGATLGLLVVGALIGAVNGALYVLARRLVVRPLLGPLWVAVTTAVVGGALVHADGVDYRILEPLGLAVGGFALLPALAALLVVRLVERRLPAPAPLRLGGRRGTALRLGAPSCSQRSPPSRAPTSSARRTRS